jgi:hypothetical protein
MRILLALSLIAVVVVEAQSQQPFAALLGGYGISVQPLNQPNPRSQSDPFPIQRIFVSDSQLTQIQKKAIADPLVKLTRGEFESRVKAASEAGLKLAPQLLEARHRVTWTPEGLQGSTRWVFKRAGLFRAEPLSVAIDPTKPITPAEAEFFHGTPLNAAKSDWVYIPGSNSTVEFHWSIRSKSNPQLERYEISFPTSAITTFDLELLNGWSPIVNGAAFLAGSLPSTKTNHTIWQIRLTNTSRFDLQLQGPASPGELQPILKVSRQSRYSLEADQVSFQIDWTPDTPRDVTSELTLIADQPVQWTEARLPANWKWSVDSGSQQVRIVPASTTWANPISLFGIASVKGGKTRTLPQVTMQKATLADDALSARLDNDLQILTHDPGDYRLLNYSSDRGSRLSYVGRLVSDGAAKVDRRPPTIRVELAAPVWDTQEDIRWRPLPEPGELSVRWRGKVRRGPIAAIRVRLPADFQLASASSSISDLTLSTTQSGRELLIELSRAFSTGETLDLRLDFRPAPQMKSQRSADLKWVLPDVTLLEPGRREGRLDISYPVDQEAYFSLASTTSEPGNITYRYTGALTRGEFQVRPVSTAPILVENTVTRLGDQLQTVSQVRYPNTLSDTALLFAPKPAGIRWTIKSDSPKEAKSFGEGFTSSTLLGCNSAWSALTLAVVGQQIPGELWEIPLQRSSKYTNLVASATGQGVGPMVTIVPLGSQAAIPQFTPSSLKPATFAAFFGVYGGLTLSSEAIEASKTYEDLSLTHFVDSDGSVTAKLSGVVTKFQIREFAAVLPPGMSVSSLAFNGKYVEQLAFDQETREVRAQLPKPLSNASLSFELHYRSPAPSTKWGFPHKLSCLKPKLANAGEFRSQLDVAPNWRIWPTMLSSVSDPGEELLLSVKPLYILVSFACICLLGHAIKLQLTSKTQVSFLVLLVFLSGCAFAISEFGGIGWKEVTRPLLATCLLSLVVSTFRLSLHLHLGFIALPMLLSTSGIAQAPAVQFVYLTTEQSLYAPKSLLNRLEQLQQIHVPNVVVQRCEYRGYHQDGLVQFRATWDVSLHADEPINWVFPLKGVRLQELTWDGQPINAEAVQSTGYMLALSGKGKHRLQARFAIVPTVSDGRNRLRFEGPECTQTRVLIEQSAKDADVEISSRLGKQVSRTENGNRLYEADHGSNGVVSIDWRMQAPAQTPSISVRQVALWDLSDDTANATFALAYSSQSGYINNLSIDIPDGLEIERPKVRDLSGRDILVRTISWDLTSRKLKIALFNPAEVGCVVVVRAYPKLISTLRPTLRLLKVSDATLVESDLAIRTNGVFIEDLPRQPGMIDYSPDSLVRIPRLGTVPELAIESRPAERVFHISGPSNIESRPLLRVGDPISLNCQTDWLLGRYSRAKGRIQGSLAQPVSNLVLDCPTSLPIELFQAPELLHWSRNADRVQLWFSKPVRDIDVSWASPSINLNAAEKQTNSAVMELPVIKSLNVADRPGLTVSATPGWVVASDTLSGWLAQPEPEGNLQRFVGTRTSLAPKFALSAAQPIQLGSLDESVRNQGASLIYTAEATLAWRSKGSFDVYILGLPQDVKPTFAVANSISVQPLEGNPAQSAWRLTVPQVISTPIKLKITVPLSVDQATPQLRIAPELINADWQSRRLTIFDERLTCNHGPEGWRKLVTWNGTEQSWISSGKAGSWYFSKSDTATSVTTASLNPTPRDILTPSKAGESVPYARVLGWVLGFVAWVALTCYCRASWWPERITVAALLGIWTLQVSTILGSVFVLLFCIGIVCRLILLLRSTLRSAS